MPAYYQIAPLKSARMRRFLVIGLSPPAFAFASSSPTAGIPAADRRQYTVCVPCARFPRVPMTPDQMVFGFIQYVVFLLSTTCHEAAHSLVAKLGGDLTAFAGGQVSLNPIPHIRREPFGMVIMPLLG